MRVCGEAIPTLGAGLGQRARTSGRGNETSETSVFVCLCPGAVPRLSKIRPTPSFPAVSPALPRRPHRTAHGGKEKARGGRAEARRPPRGLRRPHINRSQGKATAKGAKIQRHLTSASHNLPPPFVFLSRSPAFLLLPARSALVTSILSCTVSRRVAHPLRRKKKQEKGRKSRLAVNFLRFAVSVAAFAHRTAAAHGGAIR